MNTFNDNLEIETPENLTLQAPIAGFGTRCVAALIDNLILGIGMLLCAFTYVIPAVEQSRNLMPIIIFVSSVFLVTTLYHLLFELLWNGQSPGKRISGVRVIRANGLPLTPTAAIIRNVVRLFDYFPFGYSVGLITLFATPQTQRLGDLAAGTLVIKESKQITLDSVRASAAQYPRLTHKVDIPDGFEISSLSDADRQLVIDYLTRQHNLTNWENLAVLLAKQIANKMGIPNSTVINALEARQLLLRVACAFEIRDDINEIKAKPDA